jgi:hypothetical protein
MSLHGIRKSEPQPLPSEPGITISISYGETGGDGELRSESIFQTRYD